jgi:leucyl/phenylalanyl-tRNA--protein transferase
MQFKSKKFEKFKGGEFFPDTFEGVEGGLIGYGLQISTPLLLEAYSKGIFPWPQNTTEILWFSPDERGILYFDELHISKSLQKIIKQKIEKGIWAFKVSSDFAQVIEACATQKRVHEDSTWITAKIIKAYIQLHKEGYAHSFEIWEGEQLIGGLYCVFIDGVWSGESMFFKEDNASKVAFALMCLMLKEQGFAFLDTQMVTPITESFGAKLISRESYLEELEKVHRLLK